MANRGDVNRLCNTLTQMGVEIKPEELQSLSRATAFRVMTDFSLAAFLTSPEQINQQLALSLENCNPNSAATPLIQNKCILWSEAFELLSKGGPTVFEFNDLLRPETKRFNQLLQQMLKYLFYSEKLYEAVSDECHSLEGAAEEVEKQRVLLDRDREELRIIDQKIANLHQAKITEEFDRAAQQKEETLQEAKTLRSEYAELKATLEKEQAELFDGEEQLSTAEQQLLELRDFVESDPESQMSALEQLREAQSAKAALLASREKQLNEIVSESRMLQEGEQRAEKILGAAKVISHAADEFNEFTKMTEKRIEDNQNAISDLQSERDRLAITVESRNQKVAKMNEDERSKSEIIQALEREDCLKQELLANSKKIKAPLASDLSKKKQELSDANASLEESGAEIMMNITKKYDVLLERWTRHVEEVRIFEAECLKTERSQKQRHAKLQSLSDALVSLKEDTL